MSGLPERVEQLQERREGARGEQSLVGIPATSDACSGACCRSVGARHPVAVKSGGHWMWQFDARDVVKGLRVDDGQLAAIGEPVIHEAHQHAVVFSRIW